MSKKCGRLWGKVSNDEIEIRTLTRNDLEEALDVLDKSFFLNESVCNGCELNLPENGQGRLELRELSRLTVEDGVSLVAIDVAKSKVAAIAFNKIQYIPQNNEEPFFLKFRKERCQTPEAQSLMDFMIEVDSQKDVFELFRIDCVCELMFLATLPEYERRGIGRALAHHTYEMTRELSQGIGINELHPQLRDKRPRAVTAIFTSQFSQKVGRANGFKVLNTVFYDRFSFRGKTYAERIDPMHSYCEHVIKFV